MVQRAEGEPVRHERASVRTCVGCRREDARPALLRLAVCPEPPYLVPDPRRQLGGRGVAVHPSRTCIELAANSGGFARALGMRARIDARALCDVAARRHAMRAESLLIAAARRTMLAVGTEAVREALREGRVQTLVVARDAEGRAEELRAAAERIGRRAAVLGTKDSLGRLFGRAEVGVLGVLDRRMGDEIGRCAAVCAALMANAAEAQ